MSNHDVFYNTDHLSLQEKRELLILAYQLRITWKWVVIRDGEYVDKEGVSFEECLEGFGEDDHFVFIHRRDAGRLEAGYSFLSRDGMLFIFVDEAALNIFTDTFDLEEIKL